MAPLVKRRKKCKETLHSSLFNFIIHYTFIYLKSTKKKKKEKMTPLLFMVLAMEMGVIIIMLFHSPLRNLIMMGLDRLKQGRGLVTSRTVAVTFFIVFVFNLYGIFKTQKRAMEVGTTNPTDQVLLANRILEASLMGFCLFLGLMIDRLHYYVKELWLLRKSLKATRDSNAIQPVNRN
ncbi:hypothetical protein L1987_02416 [Smallanthus sonchifolius]|uniref:Uncharacterized protein n=1 Tax=Smallanthus sonchifolius TaxID=185202 RepID=A0ACB9K7M8_9ASTR|nr:hypothetical protein L1987_02416 [Smallanthus sonchifolius]